MKSVTTREIQQKTRAIRRQLESGEAMQWVYRGQVVGHLIPEVATQEPADWEDPYQRLRDLYPEKASNPEASASRQIYQDRG